ncbi:MAG: T9SS type A sorting domain-containing protein [Bacteroidia bacterium]
MTTGTYATLQAAFAVVNDGTYTGAVQISITANTTEPATAVLNASGAGAASYSAVTIMPVGGARIVSGDIAGPLVDLNGADNVTINGADLLTFSNLSISGTAGTSTIRFMGDATSNTINWCHILGSSTAITEGGNVLFSGGALVSGNDNNTLYACNIGPAGTNLPVRAIHSVGSTTSSTTFNSNITIDSCNVYDFFHPTIQSNGILVGAGSTEWTITDCRFYQTATRTQTTAAGHHVIELNSTNIDNCSITNNIIGYASSAGTGTYTLVIPSSGGRMHGIRVTTHGIITPSSIQGNTITAINISGSSSGTGSGNSPFGGIMIVPSTSNVRVNIGNLVGNTIGSTSVPGAITFSTASTSNSEIYGTYYFPTANADIRNYKMGGITASNTSTGSILFFGIRAFTGSANVDIIQNNTIGYAAAPITVSAPSSTASRAVGIQEQDGNATITGNTVSYITIDAGSISTAALTHAMAGILYSGTSASVGRNISQNTIHSLTNTHPSAAMLINGITYNASTSGTNIVSQNTIHSINVSSPAATLSGIRVFAGTSTFQNNMISLGDAMTAGTAINGILEAAGTNNFYFNSVCIGGTGVVGVANTFAFNSTLTSTRNYLNNIFYNIRSNASGTSINYGIQVGGTAPNPPGLISNYNLIYTNGTGTMFGRFNAANVADLMAWQTATGQDANSLSTTVPFVSHTNLHLCVANSGAGTPVAGVTNDIDGDTRNATTPNIGADEVVLPTITGLNATYCSGDADITLAATPSGGTFTVNGTSATEFSPGTASLAPATNAVVYTSLAGCTASQTVTVNESSDVTLAQAGGITSGTGITTLTQACVGTPVTLTAATTGPAVTNYQWQRNGTDLPGETNATFTTSSGWGVYRVRITNANTCITNADTFAVSFRSLPNAQAGTDKNVCEGSTATLGTTNNASYTYSWHPTTNLSSATIFNPIVTATTGSATYTVYVSQAIANTGGLVCSKSDAVIVNTLTPPAAPTIAVSAPATLVGNASPSLCEGSGVITLSPSGTAGATQLQWLKNGVQVTLTNNLSAVLNVSNTAGIAANYTAKVRAANGCFSPASNVIAATINQAAMPTITPAGTNNIILVCFGPNTSASELLTASVTSGTPTYAWYQSGVVTSVGSGNTYTATVTNAITSKTFNVKATYLNGCIRTSVNKVVRKNTTCREDMTVVEEVVLAEEMTAYPNPTSDKLKVTINNSAAFTGTLTLSNTLGQTVMSQNIDLNEGDAMETLDMSKLPQGIYNLTFDTETTHQVVKVVKE